MNQPVSTYRLQLHAGFDLDAASKQLDYLSALGADWLYLSPILTAATGSAHGYDVVDHSSIDPARGGRDGLDRLAQGAHARGMGILVDIVPNHMGVATPSENSWWWSILRDGMTSKYASAFDVDWAGGGRKVRLAVLSDQSNVSIVPRDAATQDTQQGLDDQGAQLDVDGIRLPLRVDVEPTDDIVTLLEQQHYELVHWTRADSELNYRRFFSIATLAGVRIELPWVFEESHREIVRWCAEGLVDGLRVDHPDGLLDPGGYLDDLARATGNTFVLVEKILGPGEVLPPHWAVAGTTGYDALAELDRVLIDPRGRTRMHDLLPGETWAELTHRTRRDVADRMFRAEILRIANDLPGALTQTADAVAEIAACFRVYRTYLPHGREHLDAAIAAAAVRRPELTSVLGRIAPMLRQPGHPAADRLQQTTGMVMAKGVEDNAFYRFAGLASLTEVGGDPSEFAIGLEHFHALQSHRQAAFPKSQTTLSTHDTKRAEDVRARISVLSEVPDEWADFLHAVRERGELGDDALESLLWETIIGAWPASRERLQAYGQKAAREAGSRTSWTRPNAEFEGRVRGLVDAAFDLPAIAERLDSFVKRLTPHGWINSLSAKLIQLAGPGVPDVYQGSELWDFSLVDPDNRRAVDFERRRAALARVDEGELPPVDESGDAKLLVTARALRLRRDHPELFTRYLGVRAIGSSADHMVAFDRGGAIAVATRFSLSLARSGGWRETTILLPSRRVVDVITGATFLGNVIRLDELLGTYPVALLAPID